MKTNRKSSYFVKGLSVSLLIGSLARNLLAQAGYREIDVKNGGTILGTVRFLGDISKNQKMEITKDTDFCGIIKPSPRLVVGKVKGVKNAIVYLEDIVQGKKVSKQGKFVLDQRVCSYEPHILIVPYGMQMKIVNSDKILHNVHAYSLSGEPKSLFNIAQPIRGQRTTITLTNAGLISTTCDAGHPWMSAYIMVARHPYCVVTDKLGNFALTDVPAGTYKIRMWHEGVNVILKEMEKGSVKKYIFEEPYEIEKEVTLARDMKLNVDFELSLRVN